MQCSMNIICFMFIECSMYIQYSIWGHYSKVLPQLVALQFLVRAGTHHHFKFTIHMSKRLVVLQFLLKRFNPTIHVPNQLVVSQFLLGRLTINSNSLYTFQNSLQLCSFWSELGLTITSNSLYTCQNGLQFCSFCLEGPVSAYTF